MASEGIRRGDEPPKEPGENPDNEEKQRAEIERGNSAIEEILAAHHDIKNALHRSDIGAVDFVWGDDKRGIRHIIKRHDEDKAAGISSIGGEDMVRKLPDVIVRGVKSKDKIPIVF